METERKGESRTDNYDYTTNETDSESNINAEI